MIQPSPNCRQLNHNSEFLSYRQIVDNSILFFLVVPNMGTAEVILLFSPIPFPKYHLYYTHGARRLTKGTESRTA